MRGGELPFCGGVLPRYSTVCKVRDLAVWQKRELKESGNSGVRGWQSFNWGRAVLAIGTPSSKSPGCQDMGHVLADTAGLGKKKTTRYLSVT